MKMSTKPGVVEQERADPAGGKGGVPFDSGRNLTGVTRISIELFWDSLYNQNMIKRVFIDFSKYSPGRDFYLAGRRYKTRVDEKSVCSFDVDPNDHILKVVVWADHQAVSALQFHLVSGHISPRYGIPSDSAKPVTYSGGEGSQLVGFYGRHSAWIDSLGFAFATRNGIPNSIGGSWTETEEDPTLFPSATK
mmetsp:Transcript_30148/g.46215  ORF Transcript_30148/g.46215 Transcript_30148/m.46215 type:complete len:192 (-) Transcript_30148:87-662(-)